MPHYSEVWNLTRIWWLRETPDPMVFSLEIGTRCGSAENGLAWELNRSICWAMVRLGFSHLKNGHAWDVWITRCLKSPAQTAFLTFIHLKTIYWASTVFQRMEYTPRLYQLAKKMRPCFCLLYLLRIECLVHSKMRLIISLSPFTVTMTIKVRMVMPHMCHGLAAQQKLLQPHFTWPPNVQDRAWAQRVDNSRGRHLTFIGWT